MLPIKLLSSNRKFLKFLIISLFFFQNILAEEKSIDIWNNKNKPKSENNKIQEKLIQEPKIDISKLNQNQKEPIKISETQSEDTNVKLVGLYDPGQNDLSLEMWMRTNGELIKQSLKRIEKIKLSKFSEEIFLNTILTYSYSPQKT